jgi:hypothetical protein
MLHRARGPTLLPIINVTKTKLIYKNEKSHLQN